MALQETLYALVMVVNFYSAPDTHVIEQENVSFEACSKIKDESNAAWKAMGDRTFVQDVTFICIPTRYLVHVN